MQLAVEQEKQKELLSGADERNKELEEAQLQVDQLQNELKVRMKLNQLQSTKVEESISIGSISVMHPNLL